MTTATVPRGKTATNGHAAATEPVAQLVGLHHVGVDQIDVGENIRIQPGELDELAASIAELGVLQPVRAIGPHRDGRYKLVWGQRRLLAARQAGLALIPVLVEPVGDEADHPGAKRSIEQLVENLQRADLNPIDEAKALKAVLEADPELTQEALAKRLGRSAPWVSNSLRLLEVAPGVQALVERGELSAAHVKAIAGLREHSTQEQVAHSAVANGFSAKRVEQEVGWRKQSDLSDVDRKAKLITKGQRLAKKMVKALEAAAIAKDATLLLGGLWDVDGPTVYKAVKAAGWTGAKESGGSFGYNPDEIGCTCTAYRWDQYSTPPWKRVCSDKAHVDAFEARKDAAAAQQKKDLRDKAKRLTVVLERGLAAVDATTARLAIAAKLAAAPAKKAEASA